MEKIVWDFYSTFSSWDIDRNECYVSIYHGKYKGRKVQREIIYTPEQFKSKTYFFIDGDDCKFTTEEELIAVIEEERRGQ